MCFTADVGQGVGETDGLEKKALGSGASKLVVGKQYGLDSKRGSHLLVNVNNPAQVLKI